MKLFRLIAPDWLKDKPRVLEGQFKKNQLKELNKCGYNIYYLPNHPSEYHKNTTIDGSQIDKFNYVFVDCDLKEKKYQSKEQFIEKLAESGLEPSIVVDSGNGIHAYWKVEDLDVLNYLRLQRRIMRFFNTDPATCNIFQLMRYPGTINTKIKDKLLQCSTLYKSDISYTCEQLNKFLPLITLEDEEFCQQHYANTYKIASTNITLSEIMPAKFGKLIKENNEAKELWTGETDDRSKNDYRLGHLMFANGFTKQEAIDVLTNSSKAVTRAPVHRISYAQNIVDKIWTFELDQEPLSQTIEDILKKSNTVLKGTRFQCHPVIDNTEHGFRLGQVIGLVAGSGVGKTAFALNMFRWFSQKNPDYHHFFIPLEQPANEIADRWQTMCNGDTSLNQKIHVMSNYDASGNFRHLSFDEIKDYIQEYQQVHDIKIGCVVIDHIGALKKKGAKDEYQDLMTICHSMKAFAVQTNTLLVMQSQTSREKAGIGDLELNKDAAFGTSTFEWYCDYLITLWQPLKRCHYEQSCPTITAFKFCKIRHKKANKDLIQEDVPYFLYFDSDRETLRDMTESEKTSFNFFLPKATNKRKEDRRTNLISYKSVPYNKESI